MRQNFLADNTTLYIPSVKKQKHKNYVYINKKQIEKLKKKHGFWDLQQFTHNLL